MALNSRTVQRAEQRGSQRPHAPRTVTGMSVTPFHANPERFKAVPMRIDAPAIPGREVPDEDVLVLFSHRTLPEGQVQLCL